MARSRWGAYGLPEREGRHCKQAERLGLAMQIYQNKDEECELDHVAHGLTIYLRTGVRS